MPGLFWAQLAARRGVVQAQFTHTIMHAGVSLAMAVSAMVTLTGLSAERDGPVSATNRIVKASDECLKLQYRMHLTCEAHAHLETGARPQSTMGLRSARKALTLCDCSTVHGLSIQGCGAAHRCLTLVQGQSARCCAHLVWGGGWLGTLGRCKRSTRASIASGMQLRLLSLLLCLGAVASSKDIETRIRNDWRQLIEICPNRIYRSCGAVDKANWTDAKRTRRLDMLELQVLRMPGGMTCRMAFHPSHSTARTVVTCMQQRTQTALPP